METNKFEEELEDLKTRLATLEKELVKEEKIVEGKEREINSNPEMVKLIEKQKELKEEQSVVEKQKEKLEKKIKEQFFADEHGYSWAYFHHRTSEWAEDTNIWCDVLDEIKQHSPLRLLRNGDIEDAVKALINKAINECPELVELKRLYNILRNEISESWEEERSLDRELREGFHSGTYSLRHTISDIKQQIANPKKFIEQQKRLSKRDEARNKLKDPKILDKIYKKLEIEIPKGKTDIKTKEEK